jgi:hypothetical protein
MEVGQGPNWGCSAKEKEKLNLCKHSSYSEKKVEICTRTLAVLIETSWSSCIPPDDICRDRGSYWTTAVSFRILFN